MLTFAFLQLKEKYMDSIFSDQDSLGFVCSEVHHLSLQQVIILLTEGLASIVDGCRLTWAGGCRFQGLWNNLCGPWLCSQEWLLPSVWPCKSAVALLPVTVILGLRL